MAMAVQATKRAGLRGNISTAFRDLRVAAQPGGLGKWDRSGF